jgi:hypothetical protein
MTVQPLALRNEPGWSKTSTMINYKGSNFPKMLQPNAATEFCDHSKKGLMARFLALIFELYGSGQLRR